MINFLKDYNPILITDINALKDLRREHNAIIFNDIDWSIIPHETKIHLFDKNRSSKVKIIYQYIEVPSSPVIAVISNKKEDLLSIFDEDKAIKRRIRHVEISKPMFTQNNISVNNF